MKADLEAETGRAHHGRVDRNYLVRVAEFCNPGRAHHGRVDRNRKVQQPLCRVASRAHHGRVDRNIKLFFCFVIALMSRPPRARGSKQVLCNVAVLTKGVAPTTGAWIETQATV